MGDKNSRPYDVFDENFKDMMLIVDSPQDLIDQISSLTENQISRKLQLMNIFYRKFIFPRRRTIISLTNTTRSTNTK